VLRLSLKDWLVTGSLGPLRIDATQAELLAAVGHPDQAGCPRLHLDFITSDRDGWPIGLYGVWQTG